MSRARIAHRADFSVRCACGIEYNTDDTHIGKQIKCRCGRVVTIARPKEEYAEAYVGAEAASRATREAAAKAEAKRAAKVRRRQWRRNGWRSIRVGLSHAAIGAVLGMWRATTSSRKWRRWTSKVVWGWLASCIALWALLAWKSESYIPAIFLAYGPRFLLLTPFAALIPFAIAFARVMLVPLALSLLIIIGPVMGGRVSFRTLGKAMPARPPANTVRIVTYNVDGGMLAVGRFDELLDATHPDVVAVQECGEMIRDTLAALAQWHFSYYAGLCTLSKWPITNVDSMPRADFARLRQFGAGGAAMVIRYTLATPHGALRVVNLHLETARKGLESTVFTRYADSDVNASDTVTTANEELRADRRLMLNTTIRDRESERASVWAEHGDRTMPTIIVGDFNLPVESEIFQRHWRGFNDAFERVGTGFGWSKQEGTLLRIRIDHVLSNQFAPQPRGVWLGRDYGSDHRPVIADLEWPAR